MQESKYTTINTKSLFEELTSDNKNLRITEKGLCLQRRVLKFDMGSLSDPNTNLLSNTYISKKTKSILTSHEVYDETKFSTCYNDPEKVVENSEGVVVDKETFYVIGTFDAPRGEKKEDLVALEKEDLKNASNYYIYKKLGLLQVENCPGPGKNNTGNYKGIYCSKAIDSRVQQTRWYRFTLEGKFPEGTNVEFHYYISDEPKNVENINWEDWENWKYWKDWEKGLSGSSAIQGEKIRDAIFRTETKGRYLWFRITLIGTEDLSPEIYSVTIFFPKVSYLEYLPPVYREDFANSDFLDRFLAIFESLFFDIDFTIDHLSRWLDAAGTPLEFLYWLGSWIGVEQGRVESLYRKEVPETKQREYIFQAVSMYKERGTRAGLENLILFYTGKKPIIIENLPFECTKGNTENENWKKDQNVINESNFGRCNLSFLVLFKEELDEDEKVLIRNIIEAEKPAHTTYKLLELRFCLDGNTYLGINTKLPPLTPLV